MNKKYELLKDLPDAKKGTELVYDKAYGYYLYNGVDCNGRTKGYLKNDVENNPEWFREIVSEPNNVELRGHSNNSNLITISSDNPISVAHYLPIKKAIEFIINPNTDTSKVEGADWEILSFWCNDALFQLEEPNEKHGNKGYYVLPHPSHGTRSTGFAGIEKIHSVKRLSDGEVFTIGDKVDSTWGTQTITSFIFVGNKLTVEFETCRNPFDKISKLNK